MLILLPECFHFDCYKTGFSSKGSPLTASTLELEFHIIQVLSKCISSSPFNRTRRRRKLCDIIFYTQNASHLSIEENRNHNHPQPNLDHLFYTRMASIDYYNILPETSSDRHVGYLFGWLCLVNSACVMIFLLVVAVAIYTLKGFRFHKKVSTTSGPRLKSQFLKKRVFNR